MGSQRHYWANCEVDHMIITICYSPNYFQTVSCAMVKVECHHRGYIYDRHQYRHSARVGYQQIGHFRQRLSPDASTCAVLGSLLSKGLMKAHKGLNWWAFSSFLLQGTLFLKQGVSFFLLTVLNPFGRFLSIGFID